MDFLYATQRWIYDSLSAELTSFAANRNWAALALVLPLGILFGAVHALTPGHGKLVLSSYLAGSRLQLLRGVALALVLAFTHVFTAVLLALAAAPLVTRTLAGAGRAPLLEHLSAVLIICIGVWLVYRAVRDPPHRHWQSHQEGIAVAITAGLVPCPLTLFAMFLALSRGVPEAGLTFAMAMLIGIGLTLAAVAVVTVLARATLVTAMERHGASVTRLARVLNGVAGAILVAAGVHGWLSAPRL